VKRKTWNDGRGEVERRRGGEVERRRGGDSNMLSISMIWRNCRGIPINRARQKIKKILNC
jgi:hypothetical protein